MANWRRKATYITADSTEPYNYEAYCGACGLEIGNPGGSPQHVDDPPRYWDSKRPYEYRFSSFCPWCGVALDQESWKTCREENLRAPDHYDGRPGEHRGDEHIFLIGADEYGLTLNTAGHAISLSCRCEPTVIEQTAEKCVVQHRGIP